MSCLTASSSLRPLLSSRTTCHLCASTPTRALTTSTLVRLPPRFESPRRTANDGRDERFRSTSNGSREDRGERTSYPRSQHSQSGVRSRISRSSGFGQEPSPRTRTRDFSPRIVPNPNSSASTNTSLPSQTTYPSPFTPIPASGPARTGPWSPTKKLTYSAMAGLKALYALDPDKFTKPVLSSKFGISVEAVSRILRSKYRTPSKGPQSETTDELEGLDHLLKQTQGSGAEDADGDGDMGLGQGMIFGQPQGPTMVNDLRGTKWDRNPSTAENVSPVPAIMRAYASSRKDRDSPIRAGTGSKR
ncbi:hypothetical protein CI109_107264 [Kwoniella shandongensis]|uniref:Required for respiratory growth protein 9, mitochondrial n=1 Tax=Kwoniella shandongensis TaxID=1734106 RepID=A0A5M6C6U9_9TREE|nr:uncharacterized protein CI109_002546 [Kwoniella shandongensis]KAA5529205.1 hypothetical protein CI109_002546 [Kwoniella shandongensis]